MKIFISYRRTDSQWPVELLRRALQPHVSDPDGDIFVDIDSIPVGVDFVEYIDQQVGKCDVLLAVIGTQWTTVKDEAGARRLDDPKDLVRAEIAAALKRGIPVAPVLIEDARMPAERDLPEDIKALARRNGIRFRRESFEADTQRLIDGLPSARRAKARKLPAWLAPALAAAGVIVAGLAVFLSSPFKEPDVKVTPRAEPQRPSSGSPTVEIRLLAINDFHGNLQPPPRGTQVRSSSDPAARTRAPGGGAARLATAVAELSKRPNTILVAAGDLIGASPLLSGLFHDEPTIESLSKMGLAISSVGSHEFDEGWRELLRMQNGGCHATDGCLGPKPFEGAKFAYLAASTLLDNGRTLFPPYAVREFDGVKVGFIGLTHKGTPNLISPAARAGLTFKDEAETVNALIPKLKAEGVEAIVVLLHEGGLTSGAGDCDSLDGEVTKIVPKFDKAVDVVISGRTHQIYICTVDGRLVTNAGSLGAHITDISLTVDRKSGDVIASKARNIAVRQDIYDEDPGQAELIAAYSKKAESIMNRPVGSIAETLPRGAGTSGESAIGAILADSILEAGRREAGKVDIAFTNSGGIRSDLAFRDNGRITFGDLLAVQPFANELVVMTLTGAEIEAILKEQYRPGGNKILQVSNGFSFAWRQKQNHPMEIVPGSVKLNGQPLVATQAYRVVTNDFLSAGGDGFSGFKAGRDRVHAGLDLVALTAWFNDYSAPTASIRGRIIRED